MILSWAPTNRVQSPPFSAGWIQSDPVLSGTFAPDSPRVGLTPTGLVSRAGPRCYSPRPPPIPECGHSLRAPPKLRDCPPPARPEVVPPLSASLGGLGLNQSALPPFPALHSLNPPPCSLCLASCSLFPNAFPIYPKELLIPLLPSPSVLPMHPFPRIP